PAGTPGVSTRAVAAAPSSPRPAVTARVGDGTAARTTESAAPAPSDALGPNGSALVGAATAHGPSTTDGVPTPSTSGAAQAVDSVDIAVPQDLETTEGTGESGRRAPWVEREGAIPDADGRADESVPAACDAVDLLERALVAVASLGDTSWHELGGRRVHEALDLVEQLDRRLTGLRADVLAVVEAEGLWALDGQRTFTAWLKQRTDTTPGSAAQQARPARALPDPLPLTRAALDAGEVSGEHVPILVREALPTHRLRAQLTDPDLGEAFLIAQARE